MIAVDTSALMAVLLGETEGAACQNYLSTEPKLLISAGTVAEALIVAGRRHLGDSMGQLIEAAGLEIVPVTAAVARRVAEAYGRWGKGVHAAGLNFGDCFAYEAATSHGCPLLFVGDDFARTDVARVF